MAKPPLRTSLCVLSSYVKLLEISSNVIAELPSGVWTEGCYVSQLALRFSFFSLNPCVLSPTSSFFSILSSLSVCVFHSLTEQEFRELTFLDW